MDKGVHAFPRDICPKMNVIARLEFEISNFLAILNHYATRTA